MKTSGNPWLAALSLYSARYCSRAVTASVGMIFVQVAERDAVPNHEGKRLLRKRALKPFECGPRFGVFSTKEIVVRDERARPGALGPDGESLLESRPRLVALVRALIELPEKHVRQPLSRIVRGDLLEKGDAVLKVGAWSRTTAIASMNRRSPRRRSSELDGLLQLGRSVVRRHEDGKVVLTQGEVRIEHHDLLGDFEEVRPASKFSTRACKSARRIFRLRGLRLQFELPLGGPESQVRRKQHEKRRGGGTTSIHGIDSSSSRD